MRANTRKAIASHIIKLADIRWTATLKESNFDKLMKKDKEFLNLAFNFVNNTENKAEAARFILSLV